MHLHEEIRQLREQLGLTQGDLAEGYATASYISIIEKGKAVPSRKVLRKIAEKLGKPPYYFEAHIPHGDDALELRTKVERLKASAGGGKLDEARAIAEELRADIPSTTDNDIRGRYLMAMAYYSWASDDMDAATSYYRQALEHFETLKWHHRRIDALYGLGIIHFRRGNMRQAADYYREAIAVEDDTRAGNPQTLNRIRIDYANCLMRMGKAKDAHRLLRVLESSTLGYQERILLMLNLSRSSQDIGNYPQAYEYSREASRLAEERDDLASRALAQMVAADILADMTDYEMAEKVLTEAELIYHRLGSTHDLNRVTIIKARLAVRTGQFDRAGQLLGSLDGNLDKVQFAEACLVQADRHRQLGNLGPAIDHLKDASEAFMEAERFGAAIDSWHKAAEIAHSAGNSALAANLLFMALKAYDQSRKGVSSDEINP